MSPKKSPKKPTQKQVRQAIVSEMAEDAWSGVASEIAKVRERLHEQVPHRVFQEKYTTGWLWNKKTHYRYYRYSEGSMIGVGIYSTKTIESLEKGK